MNLCKEKQINEQIQNLKMFLSIDSLQIGNITASNIYKARGEHDTREYGKKSGDTCNIMSQNVML